jgi:V/A-type H+-transporting ATPase subunit C
VIGGLGRYPNLNARVRALASYLISEEDWRAILATQDLRSLLETLKEIPYGRIWSFPEQLSLPELGLFFDQTLAKQYEKFIAMTAGATRELLRALWRRFELDNLKTILRRLAGGRTSWDEALIILLRDSVLPISQLQQAGDLRTAADLLSDTIYGAPLASALGRYETEKTLFPVEVALDISHWRRVWRAVGKLSGRDGNWARRLVGSRLDVTNITWAFRYHLYYHLSEEEIINYTLPGGYRSDDGVLRDIARGAGVQEVASRVWGQEVPEFADLAAEGPKEPLQAFEVALARFLCRQARESFIGYPFHLGILLGYLSLKEWEAHDLTTMAEAKAVRLTLEEIEPCLVSFVRS